VCARAPAVNVVRIHSPNIAHARCAVPVQSSFYCRRLNAVDGDNIFTVSHDHRRRIVLSFAIKLCIILHSTFLRYYYTAHHRSHSPDDLNGRRVLLFFFFRQHYHFLPLLLFLLHIPSPPPCISGETDTDRMQFEHLRIIWADLIKLFSFHLMRIFYTHQTFIHSTNIRP
jgi:hypothetical protein